MELGDYLRILRKRWIVIIAASLLGIAAAAGATLLTSPAYQASTLVYVQVASTGSVGELVQGSSFVQSQVKSFSEVVSTPRVLEPAIKSLGLEISAERLATSVTATAPSDSVNIQITVSRDSAEEAANLANAITSSFVTAVEEITTNTTTDAPQVTVSVLTAATVPLNPSSPNTNVNLALGLVIGLIIGLGSAILRETMDTRIRGQRDVSALTKVPIIGGISWDPNAAEKPLIVQDDPKSIRAEAFRTLRTNLQFLELESGAKSFVITSSIPGEGKTTTAANLAIALADSGANVVIIDADLRRPKIANYMGIEGAVGLTDVLISRVALEDALQPWGRGSLVVLPAGTIPPNPSEMLGSRAMASLVKSLETEFDVVLIDLPPLLPVTDAALVSKMTRGTLVVVAAGRTHKGELAGALHALENVGANVAGVIVTMMPTKGPDAYGYGSYGYGSYEYSSDAVKEPNVADVNPADYGQGATAAKRVKPFKSSEADSSTS